MALRTLGASLVAKSTPGAKYRETAEAQVQTPGENQGQPGSLSRVQVEEPLERAVSPGSSKSISVKPLLEPTLPGDKLGSAGLPFIQSFGGQPGAGGAGRVVAPVAPVVQPPQPQQGGGNQVNQVGGNNNQSGGGGGELRSQVQAQQAQPVFRSQAQVQRAPARPTVTKVGGRTIAQDPNKKLRSLA